MIKGYLHIACDEITEEEFNIVKSASELCDELIIGVPKPLLFSRVFGSEAFYDYLSIMRMWKSFPFVSDVVDLDMDELTIEESYKKLRFDVYFCGCEYGADYLKDIEYAKTHGIKVIPLLPSENVGMKMVHSIAKDGLEQGLANARPDWNVVYLSEQGDEIERLSEQYDPEKTMIVITNCDYVGQRDRIVAKGFKNYRLMRYVTAIAVLDELGLLLRDERKYVQDSQNDLLGILREFDSLCREHGLKYYFICGSLIGAMRHEGFIPWDDDLDIAMPREDYEKFKKIFYDKWGRNKHYRLSDPIEWTYEVFVDCMPRIRDMSKSYTTKVNTNIYDGKNLDLFIHKAMDIYILDDAFDEKWKHNIHMGLLKIIYNLCMGHRKKMDYSQYDRLNCGVIFLMKIINGFGRLLPLKKLLKWYDSVCRIAAGRNSKCYFMSGCPIVAVERKFEKDLFGEGKNVKFEDETVFVPDDGDTLLTEMSYSEYMSEPSGYYRRPSHFFASEIEIW